MAEPAFCTIEDLQGYEADITDLSASGNLNAEMAAARKEIEDRLITSGVIRDLDKLGPDIKPRQLRTPAIFKTLEMIYTSNTNDDESPYANKADVYGSKFDAAFGAITFLDLDQDEDGSIQESEENSKSMNWGRVIRR